MRAESSLSYDFAARVFFGFSSTSAAALRTGFFFVAVMDAVFVLAADVSRDFEDFVASFAGDAFFSATVFAGGFLDAAFFTDFPPVSAFFAVLVRVDFFGAAFFVSFSAEVFADAVRFFGVVFSVAGAASAFFAAAAFALEVTDFFLQRHRLPQPLYGRAFPHRSAASNGRMWSPEAVR